MRKALKAPKEVDAAESNVDGEDQDRKYKDQSDDDISDGPKRPRPGKGRGRGKGRGKQARVKETPAEPAKGKSQVSEERPRPGKGRGRGRGGGKQVRVEEPPAEPSAPAKGKREGSEAAGTTRKAPRVDGGEPVKSVLEARSEAWI